MRTYSRTNTKATLKHIKREQEVEKTPTEWVPYTALQCQIFHMERKKKEKKKERRKAGGRAGRREGGKAGGKEGRKAGGKEGRRTGRREGGKAGGKEGRKAGGKEGRRAGRREGRQAGIQCIPRSLDASFEIPVIRWTYYISPKSNGGQKKRKLPGAKASPKRRCLTYRGP